LLGGLPIFDIEYITRSNAWQEKAKKNLLSSTYRKNTQSVGLVFAILAGN